MSESISKLNEQIHQVLAEELLGRLKSGEATTQDLNVARQFLKDNGITGVATDDKGAQNPLGALATILPFPKVKSA
jgi:hypothetical protein